MPDIHQKRDMPDAIAHTLIAMEALRSENPILAEQVAKALPGYALQLMKQGQDVSPSELLDAARLGPAFLKAAKLKPGKKTYDTVLRAFPKAEDFYEDFFGPELAQMISRYSSLEHIKALKYPSHLDDADIIRYASGTGYLEMIECLNANSWDIKDTDKENAVIYAAEHGLLDTIRWWNDHGVNIRTYNDGALQRAIEHNHLETAIGLLDLGLKISNDNPDLKWTLLRTAKKDFVSTIKWAEQHGADISVLSDNFKELAEKKCWGIINYLCEKDESNQKKLNAKQKTTLSAWQHSNAKWQKHIRVSPPDGLQNHDPALFRPTAFQAVVNMLAKEGYEGWEAHQMAYQSVALFGTETRILEYLERWGKPGKQPLHDIIHKLKLPKKLPSAEHLNNWSDAVLKCGPEMISFVSFSDRMPSPIKNGAGWSLIQTRYAAAGFVFFRGAEHPDLAALCMHHAVEENRFNTALDIVLKGHAQSKNIPDFSIPGERFGMPGASFHRLATDDIRGLFLGEETNCCQSVDSAGSSCAIHGYTSEESGFYVVENAEGKIIGQTWAWRGSKGELIFDSLETLGENIKNSKWTAILLECVKELDGIDHDVKLLAIGYNKTTTSLAEKFRRSASPAKLKDYDGYTDAEQQVLVWDRKKGLALSEPK